MITINNESVDNIKWVFPAFEFNFKYALHQMPSEGWLAWEYNPFFNLKLADNSVKIGSTMYSIYELEKDWRTWKYQKDGDDTIYDAVDLINALSPDDILYDGDDVYYNYNGDQLKNWEICNKLYKFHSYSNKYGETYFQKGSLVDFDTSKFHFSLNHPVQIECQHSYDGSVNLIINDNYNQPMLVNSRFTVMDGSKYKVIDRYGNNDTNIYDEDFLLSDTSLFCNYKGFPSLEIDYVHDGGNLFCGNYVFYFRFCNADGDHTDFVSYTKNIFLTLGENNSPWNQKSGYENENSHKMVCLSIWNDENNYDYAEVFYTRTTGGPNGEKLVEHKKIDIRYPLTTNQIMITGNEHTSVVSEKYLNERMLLFKRAKTQCQSNGRLFMANLTRTDVPYNELTRASLSLLPLPYYKSAEDTIGLMNTNYTSDTDNCQYYNFENVINNVGYFPEEIYRFGIVYILHDGTYTCVFPLRGGFGITPESDNTESNEKYYSDLDNLYDFNKDISYSETDFTIKSSDIDVLNLENIKGVCQFKSPTGSDLGGLPVLGVRVKIAKKWIDEIKKYAKGYFFVRQKRSPLLLCQGIGVGVEKESGCVAIKSSSYSDSKGDYIIESFTDKGGHLTNSFKDRLVDTTSITTIKDRGLLVPELMLDKTYLHDFINGNECVIRSSWNNVNSDFVEDSMIGSFVIKQSDYVLNSANFSVNSKLFTVNQYERNYYLNDGYKFNYAHGVGETALEFSSIGSKIELDKYEGSSQVLRGETCPFVGTEVELAANNIYNIYIPGYSQLNMKEYYLTRVYNKSEYYPISSIVDIDKWHPDVEIGEDSVEDKILYSGDCFICQVTMRLMHNFADPSNPINDSIINYDTWHDYWYNLNHKEKDTVKDTLVNVAKGLGDMVTGGLISAVTTEDVDKEINTGDINAVQLGHWATFTVYSSTNLIRTEDYSFVEESAMFGSPRSFYPFSAMSRIGRKKMDESYLLNQGLSTTLSSLYFFEKPDLPYIKDVFETRIAYSKLHATDGTSNKYRYFMSGNYKDYPITYGGITKIIPYKSNIIVVFEHGIGIANVDAVVKIEDKIVKTGDVLPDKLTMLTDTYGSQWVDSIIITGDGSDMNPGTIYGVDTVNKAIWCIKNGTTFIVLSTQCIEPFLNDNITLTERELTPVIGIRNVKSHYVHYKKDIIFTFYDNLTGFEETSWSLVYNELKECFITFYSWMPSYSGNIDKMYFSFNRNVSKNISKLWYSMNNEYIIADNTLIADGKDINIYPSIAHLSTNLITKTTSNGLIVPEKAPAENTEQALKEAAKDNKMYCTYEISIERDPLGNYLQFVDPNFDIEEQLLLIDGKLHWKGYWDDVKKDWRVDSNGNYISESPDPHKVYLLYIQCNVDYLYYKNDINLKEYTANLGRYMKINAGYFQQVMAFANYDCVYGYCEGDNWIYPLATDFWKHGNAGLIDICEKLKPAHWYGKQHPFEFEVYNITDSDVSFSNLTIVSNNAIPESFHYSINANPYVFYKDLNNMYFRQEAVKHLYQYNYHDILCNNNYIDTPVEQKILPYRPSTPVADKSVLFPLYYSRYNTYNEIEDSYQRITGDSRNYQCLSGTEVTYDHVQNRYGLSVHVKANPIGHWYKQDLTESTARMPKYRDNVYVKCFNGSEYVDITLNEYDKLPTKSNAKFYIWNVCDRLRGNCWFKEGLWMVQIPSIQMYKINEPLWSNISATSGNVFNHPILNLSLNPVPGEPELDLNKIYIPKKLLHLQYSKTNNSILYNKNWMLYREEARIKGSYMKTRIRYEGSDLALVKGIVTSYL